MVLPCVIALSALFVSPEQFAEASGCRCGRIIIEGNTETPDRVILARLSLRPGQLVRAESLTAFRRDIRKCGLFKTNPWQNTGPTVELVHNEFDSIFRDILIRVEEKPGNWLMFGVIDLVHIIVNLDPDGFAIALRELRRAGRISVQVDR